VARLGRVGRLVAQSPRVAEIYAELGVSRARLEPTRFTLGHIEGLRPRRVSSAPARLTFATLNGCASLTKGSEVVLTALRALHLDGLEGRFTLRVLGHVDPAIRVELAGFRGVQLGGLYEREQLDRLLDDVDVGIMPSVWEEAFGYTGLELLAKGIPLIANPLGGIVEYAIAGETAWLNRSCSGAELAELIKRLIRAPGEVLELHRRVVAARDRLIMPMAEHVDTIERVYARAR
ncbi:MAG: glycosyltransferase, partial [Actinomycetota bacterium]|nr:glycosyltransferase [Actinomycetota bacterium]